MKMMIMIMIIMMMRVMMMMMMMILPRTTYQYVDVQKAIVTAGSYSRRRSDA